jgi:hypothetical protein
MKNKNANSQQSARQHVARDNTTGKHSSGSVQSTRQHVAQQQQACRAPPQAHARQHPAAWDNTT